MIRFSWPALTSVYFLATLGLLEVNGNEGRKPVINSRPLNIHRDRITVSGFSSGGTMAQHMQVSHSSIITGMAVFSHAFYRCGPGDGNIDNYDNACTQVGPLGPTSPQYQPELAIADIQKYHREGLIDNPSNLKNRPLYVYAGLKSSYNLPATSLAIVTVFEPFIRNTSAIRTRVQPAERVLPTANTKFGPCNKDASSTFHAASCGLNGAYEALNFILGGKLSEPPAHMKPEISRLQNYNQTQFLEARPHDLDSLGYIYIPKACEKSKCRLHLYFHGCSSGREYNGSKHIENSGYLQVAELNGIIMLFPQAVRSEPNNLFGCWDTKGVTGKHYATRRGAQVKAVRNMIAQLLGQPTPQQRKVHPNHHVRHEARRRE